MITATAKKLIIPYLNWMPFFGKQLDVHPLPQEHYSNEPFYLQLLRYGLQQKPFSLYNSPLPKNKHSAAYPEKFHG